jgi:hypothetical protein
MKLAVFDIEVFLNLFICCVSVKDEKFVFEISERKNQFKELIEFFTQNKYVFVGYNCSHYDTPIINALIVYQNVLLNKPYNVITKKVKDLSDVILDRDQSSRSWSKYKYANYFHQVDLMTLMASKALRVGLKSLQITMCYPNVKESNIPWDKPVLNNEIDEVINYCNNDIGSTSYLLKLLLSEIKFRLAVQKEFNINCLSKDGVGIGVEIFTNYICEELGVDKDGLYSLVDVDNEIYVKDIIVPEIKFKTPEFQALLDWYKNLSINLKEYEKLTDKEREERYKFVVHFNSLSHAYGLGGMHSQNLPMIYHKTDTHYLSDEDVESYYPSLALKWLFGPKGFKIAFLKVMQFLKDSRIEAKKTGDKVKDQLFKLALNSILGNLKNKYSPFYDPAANMAICINGQLFLSMLIEELELMGIECISSNTDGATFKVPYKMKEEYEKVLLNWQELSRMKLEETLYEKMVILAVNDYLAFKEGYSKNKHLIDFDIPETSVSYNNTELLLKNTEKSVLRNKYVKEKGLFITVPRLGKGLEFLIIPKALQNYFGKDIPIEKTIKDFKSIHDYVKTEKVGKQFNVKWNDIPQQHINRFYVKRNAPYLYKWKWTIKVVNNKELKVVSETNLLKESGVELVNDLATMNNFQVDYNYYIRKAREVIRDLQPEQLSIF